MAESTAGMIISFVGGMLTGAVVGALVSWIVAKKQYTKLRHAELDEVRQLYFGDNGPNYYRGIVKGSKTEEPAETEEVKAEETIPVDVIEQARSRYSKAAEEAHAYDQKDSVLISEDDYDNIVPGSPELRDTNEYLYIIETGALLNQTDSYYVDSPASLLGVDAIKEIVRLGFVEPTMVYVQNRVTGRRFQVEVRATDVVQ